MLLHPVTRQNAACRRGGRCYRQRMDYAPDNSELDALFRKSADHPAERPALFRAMLEAELYTLVPRGNTDLPPDAMAVVEPVEGQTLEFIRWGSEGAHYHFVFTSVPLALRAVETLKSSRAMLIMALPGEEMLRAMHRDGVGIAVNPATNGPQLLCNDKLVKGILDGALLEGGATEEEVEERGSAIVLPPEEYPLTLVQPLFEMFKTRPEVVAAWVLQPVEARQRGARFYVFGVLTTVEDADELARAMRTVLTLVDAKDRENLEFAISILDYGDPGHVAMMREQAPFYATPGYRQPAL